MSNIRIGIDVGGTCTDFYVLNADGSSRVLKTLSTPADPSDGVFNGLAQVAAAYGLSAESLLKATSLIVHGTTVATNTLLTRSGVKVGLLVTDGFRDHLEMRRGIKTRLYDLHYDPPPPLVPRFLRLGVKGRINAHGEEVAALDETSLRDALEVFRDKEVDAVAISYLFSFLDSSHEEHTRDVAREMLPDAYLSVSSEILPEIREYERTSTVVLNAYIGPIVSRYIESLDRRLRDAGFNGTLLIMQSNGGVMSPGVATRFAANTLLSGPAAGPAAGLSYAQEHGWRDIISIDMGGTSFDAVLVHDGAPTLTTEGAIADYHIASPIIDIHTIGAGGGSIAWIDAGGMLRVGPQSAGADPGPACYGRGGDAPTVTDADVVLGYVNPNNFLGGSISLDPEASRRVIAAHVAQPLDLDVIEAARGIFDIVNAQMADGIRIVSVEKGFDPREFVLVAAGGAGPIHACAMARELEIPNLIVPRESAVFCAVGMLLCDLKHDFVRTYRASTTEIDFARLRALFAEMETAGAQMLRDEGMPDDAVILRRSLDMRYIGQPHEVGVSLAERDIEMGDIQSTLDLFHARHELLYGYANKDEPAELLNVRLEALGVTPRLSQAEIESAPGAAPQPYDSRRAFFHAAGGFLDTPVYASSDLRPAQEFGGPAIIEMPNTTVVVTPDYRLSVDRFGNFLLRLSGHSPIPSTDRPGGSGG